VSSAALGKDSIKSTPFWSSSGCRQDLRLALRPHISNDNPYSESQFRTLKYRPEFPDRFGCLQDSRAFCQGFFRCYNQEHRHSGLGLLTPAMVHYGQAENVLRQRQAVIDVAYQLHPGRFVRKCSEATPTSQRSLDQQAGRMKCSSEFGPVRQNRDAVGQASCRSSILPLPGAKSFGKNLEWVPKTKNSLNSGSICLRAVDTRRWQWFFSAVSIPDKPSSASSQRYEVLVSKKFRMAPRTAALSSTTRIQCLRAGFTESDATTVLRQTQYVYTHLAEYF
jgi:hypothetical protein